MLTQFTSYQKHEYNTSILLIMQFRAKLERLIGIPKSEGLIGNGQKTFRPSKNDQLLIRLGYKSNGRLRDQIAFRR